MTERKRLGIPGGKAILLLTFLLIVFVLFQAADLSEALSPQRIVAFLEQLGPIAPWVFILTMAVAVVISPIPSLPLDVAAGAAFGPNWGTLYAVVGAEAGAIISFLIGRALGRDVLTRLLRIKAVLCERCSDKHLFILVLFSRLLPVFSFDLISYGAGVTRMSLGAFSLATLLGMIPPTYALTAFGRGILTFEVPTLLLGAAMVMLFLFLPKILLRYRRNNGTESIGGTFLATDEDEVPTDGSGPPSLPHCVGCGRSVPDVR